MVRRKAKTYSRFNVAAFMEEKRRLNVEKAKAHAYLVKERSKLKRLSDKVNESKLCFPVNMM